jgi:Na+/proline symporter
VGECYRHHRGLLGADLHGVLTVTAVYLALVVLFVWWATRPTKKYTTSEWIAAMKRNNLGVK